MKCDPVFTGTSEANQGQWVSLMTELFTGSKASQRCITVQSPLKQRLLALQRNSISLKKCRSPFICQCTLCPLTFGHHSSKAQEKKKVFKRIRWRMLRIFRAQNEERIKGKWMISTNNIRVKCQKSREGEGQPSQ